MAKKDRPRTYSIWANIKSRCFNPNFPRYSDYGGRGITICDEWRDSYETFYKDVGEPPSSKHTLDRINNDGNYEPSNVRWATVIEQNQNSRRAVQVEINGTTKCISEWCRTIGLAYTTYKQRRRTGWSIEKALSTPPNYKHRSKKVVKKED